MLSVIENLKQGLLKRFHGGIHPATHKTDSNINAIGRLPLAETFIIPLKQHVGQAGDLLVNVGDAVLKGQALTHGETGLSVPIHAPTSGTIIAVEDRTIPHPSALSERCIVLQADGKDTWATRTPMLDWQNQPSHRLLDAIHQAGIVGMGGAGFPTHRKLQSGLAHCEILIINGAECESYITADDRLMREHAQEIVAGTEILMHLLQPKLTVFAIEDNKPDAIKAISSAIAPFGERMMVSAIPTRYPSGGSKQLIELLTGKEVPTHGHSNEIGVIVQNTGTAYAIAQAILTGKPLIERVVTLTGNQVGQKGNYWLPIGTPIEHALSHTQYQTHKKHPRVILGGSLMGFTLPHTQVPIVKTTNCVLLPDTKELPLQHNEMPCIRCGDCAEVCPVRLQPQHLFWLAKQQDDEACQQAHLDDCIECGACAYVCPSEIPLVQYYRQSKARILHAVVEQQKADRARQRFEAKKQRAEKEKAQKAMRAQQAAEARAQSANTTTQTDVVNAVNRIKQNSAPKSAVAAAIARAKAKQAESAAQGQTAPDNSEMMKLREERKRQAREKKAQKAANNTDKTTDDKQAAVAAAIARAKARKAQQAQSTTATEPESAPAATETDDKKAAVAAAIARAKAKKTQQAQSTVASEPESAPAATETDDKKAAVAAAIARAKARKAQQAQSTTTAEPESAPAAAEADDKKAAVAAAIARAKAKKAQQAQSTVTSEPEGAPAVTEADDKKAAVAAAIARAKARKAQQAQSTTAAEPESAPTATEADDKKTAVAAAIARAKARKAQQAQSAVTSDPESAPAVTEADDKKAAVAAAIARAKAKKAQQAQSAVTSDPESAPAVTEADDKKAAVAAAIARAKARKAQLAAQKHNEEK